jgi:hypothetical protein
MLEAQEIRNGVECVNLAGTDTLGDFYIISHKGPKPDQRGYLGAVTEAEAISSAHTMWLFNSDVELFRDNGNRRHKRIRIM